MKLFDFFPKWIVIRLTWNLSQIQSRFLPGVSGKNYFGRIFQKFCANQSYTLPKLAKFRHTFCNFILDPYCIEKKFIQLLLYVFCTQVRRQVHKQKNHKKKIRGRKVNWRFVFGKPILFTLGLGLIAPYSLSILVWNFYQTFFIVSIEFWLRNEPQNRPIRFAINFYLSLTGLRGRFVCVRNCLIFFLSENSSVWPEICRILSQIQSRFLPGVSGKKIF